MQASEAAEATAATTMINTTSSSLPSLSDPDMALKKASPDFLSDKDEQAVFTNFVQRIPHSYLVTQHNREDQGSAGPSAR